MRLVVFNDEFVAIGDERGGRVDPGLQFFSFSGSISFSSPSESEEAGPTSGISLSSSGELSDSSSDSSKNEVCRAVTGNLPEVSSSPLSSGFPVGTGIS